VGTLCAVDLAVHMPGAARSWREGHAWRLTRRCLALLSAEQFGSCRQWPGLCQSLWLDDAVAFLLDYRVTNKLVK